MRPHVAADLDRDLRVTRERHGAGVATPFPAAHEDVTPVSDDAFVASVFGVAPPVVNCVEVIVRFQPAPVPRVSCSVVGTVYVGVWSPRSRLSEKLGVAEVLSDSVLPVNVPVTVAVAAEAAAGSTSAHATAHAPATTDPLKDFMRPFLFEGEHCRVSARALPRRRLGQEAAGIWAKPMQSPHADARTAQSSSSPRRSRRSSP